MATSAMGSGAKRARDYTRRQSELLDQLESMILRQGFRTITLDEIVAKLGCSRSTLYQIASSREELILIAIERWHKRVSAKGVELRSRHKDPVELLIAWSEVMRSETADVSLAFLEDQKSTRDAQTSRTSREQHFQTANSSVPRCVSFAPFSSRSPSAQAVT